MKTNDRVHYTLHDLDGEGTLLGFSAEFPVTGKMWIVLLDKPVEWGGNIWKAIVVPECYLRVHDVAVEKFPA